MEENNLGHCLPGYITRVFPTACVDDDVMDIPKNTPCIPKSLLFCLMCSIIMHIVDMGLDYNIAIQYLLSDEIIYFVWTICVIIIPSLINCLISRRMQCQDKEVI